MKSFWHTPHRRRLLGVLALAGMVVTTNAEPIRSDQKVELPPVPAPNIQTRFSKESVSEVPDFQKHVIPLLGKLGCNGRSCHGSFQGRGDFQLSLFGYDFKADHDELMAEDTGRIDVDDIDESLILAKPSDADLHEGGKRFDKDGWQYKVIRQWIAEGATFDPSSVQELKKLEIVPSEIQFQNADQDTRLRAIAHWADGTAEDVTPLCRFSSNDDAIASVDEHGLVQSGESGDTHVVISYDNAVVPVPVVRPIDSRQKLTGSIAQSDFSQTIDQLVQQKLDKLGIVASALCTDEEFVRRASLDITGVLPAADRVEAFLKDSSESKRSDYIDELLQSPAYGAWWATRMSDWTGNSDEQLNNVLPVRNVSSKLWFKWLQKRFDDNMPYDEIVEGIVTASTREKGESYLDYCREMTEICGGNLDKYAERESMPLYWARRNFQKSEDRAIGFAYAFLGVRIECAQCHKHPFDQWSKQDFDDFAQLFTTIRAGNANVVSPASKSERDELTSKIVDGRDLKGGELRRAIQRASQKGEVVPFGELFVTARGLTPQQKKQRELAKKKGRKVPPARIPTGKILGEASEVELSEDPRPALMAWLRDESNPYFAKAIVNRVWSNYFGIGIVDPSDDMNLANPPSNAGLLDHLASEFVAHDFDLKWLHREIANSETYQRSAETNTTNIADRTNFSHHIPRRLPAEVVYDMVMLATGSTKQANQLRDELDQMAIADGKARTRNNSDFALQVFGQSIRETNCDCDRSDSPSLLQAIYLRNDADMHKRLADKDGWVSEVCQDLGIKSNASSADEKMSNKERQDDNMRRAIVDRVKQFKKLPKARQEKMRPTAEKQYERMANRLGPNYEVPSLDELIANPTAWKELQRRQDNEDVASNRSKLSMDQVIQKAYLRTLSRYPDTDETAIATDYINQSDNPATGLEGLLWALVNTKEFIISH
ncbi:DUF1549 and DUF1553 domain-containing protein [Stieleria sp. JC731]|uniref:DUF1549 and DUF1553 domain-containing protein n=1 Tax=Pirellulaceae TaxID=2691357 RepID=UPI001E4178C0|nr:DUF1549 and DUF1553 domain-containing protein [Stieleria sp. JC731]MCC9599572.1 DUF1549 and DUF1553 domain-containing protein [Stieleria sp. JC731]